MDVALFGTALFGVACGPRPNDDDISTSGASASSETGMPTSGVTSSTSTSTGDASTSTGSDNVTGTCEPSSGGGKPECPADTEECSLEHQFCILGLTEFSDDCGVVKMADDLMKWQGAHECAMAAANEQRTFKLIADQFGFDSRQTDAYAAEDACPYVITKVHYDDDPCGGEECGPVVFVSKCATLTVEPGCTVEPGDVCLRCGLPGEATQVCGP